MKTIRYIVGSLVLLSVLSSCEDHLDPKVDTPFGDEYAFTLPGKVEGFLVNAYTSISGQVDGYGGDFLDAATGDATTNQYDANIYSLGAGKMSTTSNPIGNWDASYTCFQWIHLCMDALEDKDKVKFWLSDAVKDSSERQRLMGEAYFLRAYWGMELLRVYGGVSEAGDVLGYPIVTAFVSDEQKEAALDMPRHTYEECVLQILEDCDSAISILPMTYTGSDNILGTDHVGRGSGAAALVLKSRVATFAASPAFNGGQDVQAKWERAALFSQEAISQAGLSYTALSYYAVTTPSLSSTPSDYLFRKYHNNNSLETRNLPPAFWGDGRTNPSQNLVDAFPDKDGFPIKSSLLYDPQDPYANRDKRLESTVICNGANVETGGRSLEVASSITENVIVKIDTVGTELDELGATVYLTDTTFKVIERMGYDAPGYDYRCTRTGYYLRKWISDKAAMLDINQKLNSEHMHVLIRGAEAFYNLAEASNEATGNPKVLAPGCSMSAYDVISETRSKSIGLSLDPYLDAQASVDQMRTLIQNERRLEFAFENHRYFDMRRWKMPLAETVRGMRVTQDVNGVLTYEGTNPNDPASFIEVEMRPFNSERYYYQPLPYDELIKSSNLVNNTGW